MEQGIKEWVIKLSKDETFAKKYEGKSAKEVSEIAKKDGFNFTAEEFMDLQMEAASGGGVLKAIKKGLNKAAKYVKDNPEVVQIAAGALEAMSETHPEPADYLNFLNNLKQEEDD